MEMLSKLDRLRRKRGFKFLVGASAAGIGATTGAALGAADGSAPESVRLGSQESGAALIVEGKNVRVRAGDRGLRSRMADRLDSRDSRADTMHSAATGGTGTGRGRGSGSPDSPNTHSPDSPDTPDTPATPDTPDSPDSN